MTFEERLDRLTERHEALAQSMELSERIHQDKMREIEELHRKNEEAIAVVVEQTSKNSELIARNSELIAQTSEAVAKTNQDVQALVKATNVLSNVANTLVDVVHRHEMRITHLEDQS